MGYKLSKTLMTIVKDNRHSRKNNENILHVFQNQHMYLD